MSRPQERQEKRTLTIKSQSGDTKVIEFRRCKVVIN